MSVDSWGGGSDQDPKLRLKEMAALNAKLRKAYAPLYTPKIPWAAIGGLMIIATIVLLTVLIVR